MKTDVFWEADEEDEIEEAEEEGDDDAVGTAVEEGDKVVVDELDFE